MADALNAFVGAVVLFVTLSTLAAFGVFLLRITGVIKR